MTPEEWAAKIVRIVQGDEDVSPHPDVVGRVFVYILDTESTPIHVYDDGYGLGVVEYGLDLRRGLADWIRAVAAETREACAQLADEHVGHRPNPQGGIQPKTPRSVRCEIAAAIRALSAPSSVGRASPDALARDPQGEAAP